MYNFKIYHLVVIIAFMSGCVVSNSDNGKGGTGSSDVGSGLSSESVQAQPSSNTVVGTPVVSSDASSGLSSESVQAQSSSSTVGGSSMVSSSSPVGGDLFVAGHEVATEQVLRSIPVEYINTARNTFHVAYQHTSHGTHVSYGMFGLQDYKAGDDILFGIKKGGTGTPDDQLLNYYDYAFSKYAVGGQDASDLSRNEVAFVGATRSFLDDPDNAAVNVVMWAWCNIAGHDVAGNYLPGIDSLKNEYGVGGSKIGSGKRTNPVHFILMTGHANTGNNVGEGKPKDQADLITAYCNENSAFCLDYHSIDTHDMDGNYWEDAGDNGNSNEYGGNFYQNFQDTHAESNGWYNNLSAPDGSVKTGSHNTQHISANRKAYAMWWILARLSGWNGRD